MKVEHGDVQERGVQRVDHREAPGFSEHPPRLGAAVGLIPHQVQERNPMKEHSANGQRHGLRQDQDERVRPDRVHRHEHEQDRREVIAEVRDTVLRIEEQAPVERLPDAVVHDAEVVKGAVAAQMPEARRHAEGEEMGKGEPPRRAHRVHRSRALSLTVRTV